jgi:uncharacterized protein (TIGR02246 family)
MSVRWLFANTVLAVVVGCAGPSHEGRDGGADAVTVDEDVVLAVFDVGVAAWNRGDLEGYLATYAPDAVYVSGGKVLRGLEVIADSYRGRFGEGAAMGQLRVERLTLEWSGAGRAFATGHWILAREGQPEARGVFSVGLRQIDGRWLIASDHSSGES